MKTISRLLLPLALLVSVSACTTLKSPAFSDDNGAIRGYDPVAYHTEQRPVEGSAEHTYRWNDAYWHFASADNLELFRQDPERYAPQYGGFCAYAMSKGYVVSTDPHAWEVVDDKLYLNYSLGVRKTWLKDVPGYVEKADRNWQKKIAKQDFE